MTIREAIERLDTLKPNMAPEEQKVRWLSEVDGQVWNELILKHEDAPFRLFNGYDAETDPETELLVPYPYDALYIHYLSAQVDLLNQEIGKYNNSAEMYNQGLKNYSDYYTGMHMPIRSGHWRV